MNISINCHCINIFQKVLKYIHAMTIYCGLLHLLNTVLNLLNIYIHTVNIFLGSHNIVNNIVWVQWALGNFIPGEFRSFSHLTSKQLMKMGHMVMHTCQIGSTDIALLTCTEGSAIHPLRNGLTLNFLSLHIPIL